MRIIFVILLAFTLMPGTSLAQNKRVIDYYQQALSDYKYAITDLKAAHAEITAVRDDAAKKVAKIEALIAKYEAALETTRQEMEKKHEARLKQLEAEHAKTEAAYVKKLDATAELAEIHRKSAKQADEQINALLTELGTSAEKVAKLTEAVSVKDGNVGIGTTNPGTRLDIKGDAPAVRIWGQRGDDIATLRLREADANYGFDVIYNGKPDNKLYIEAFSGGKSTGKHLTIKRQSGNVGIGTTSPQAKLHVEGTVKAETFEGSVKRFNSYGTSVEPDSADKSFIKSDCAIGTVTAAKLEIQAAICVCVDGEKGNGWYCFQ